MARYTESVCRLCRREGMKLFLKGSRCYSKKCAFERRPSPPGQHGVRRRKMGDFGIQLREKQKVRRVYGVLERPFNNAVYRMGFASSRPQARQLVTHGHFAVNGRATNIASYQLRPGDRIEVRESRTGREPFKLAKETLRSHQAPEWLSVDPTKLAGTVVELPRREQMPQDLNEQLVVEYYSR
jgi:small subunit ribosomal protein S4